MIQQDRGLTLPGCSWSFLAFCLTNMQYLFSSVYSAGAILETEMTLTGDTLPRQGFTSTCILVRGDSGTERGKEKVLLKTRSVTSLTVPLYRQWFRTVSSWLATGLLVVTSGSWAEMVILPWSRLCRYFFLKLELISSNVDTKRSLRTVASRIGIIWKLVDGLILDP